jgi:hypothetical protein
MKLLYERYENINIPASKTENENILTKLETKSGIVSDTDKNYNRADILNKIALFRKKYPLASILDTKAYIKPIIKPTAYSIGYYILIDDPNFHLDDNNYNINLVNKTVKIEKDNVDIKNIKDYCNYQIDDKQYYVTDSKILIILNEKNIYYVRMFGAFAIFVLIFLIFIACLSTVGFNFTCLLLFILLIVSLISTVVFAYKYYSINNYKRDLLLTKGTIKCIPKLKLVA